MRTESEYLEHFAQILNTAVVVVSPENEENYHPNTLKIELHVGETPLPSRVTCRLNV